MPKLPMNSVFPVRRVTTEMQRALSRLKVALKDYLPVSLILLLLDAN